MAKKKSKGKPTSRAKKKKASRKLPWFKIVICLLLLLGVVLYVRGRYGTIYPPMDILKKSYQADTIAVDLYYADPERDGLTAEQRDITPASSLNETITSTLLELMKGPRGDLINAIPEQTRLDDLHIDEDGVVWVDFSSHLSSAHPGGSSAEIITVYSIVNTILLNFEEVDKVHLLIEGTTVDTLAGHIDCTKPFVADRGLVY